jgi:hypothetical protein
MLMKGDGLKIGKRTQAKKTETSAEGCVKIGNDNQVNAGSDDGECFCLSSGESLPFNVTPIQRYSQNDQHNRR